MPMTSAGILMYRFRGTVLQIFLVHPGGPFWIKKDAGAWSIPKGIPDPSEDLLTAAKRELREETGLKPDNDNFIELSPVKTRNGKIIHAWGVKGDCDPAQITSNTFSIEWPPKSGKLREFPEVDRGAWFDIDEAKGKINQSQLPLVKELAAALQETQGG